MTEQDYLEEWCEDPGFNFRTFHNDDRGDGLHECELEHVGGRHEKYKVGDKWARASLALNEGRQVKFTSKDYVTYETDDGTVHIKGPDIDVSLKNYATLE